MYLLGRVWLFRFIKRTPEKVVVTYVTLGPTKRWLCRVVPLSCRSESFMGFKQTTELCPHVRASKLGALSELKRGRNHHHGPEAQSVPLSYHFSKRGPNTGLCAWVLERKLI